MAAKKTDRRIPRWVPRRSPLTALLVAVGFVVVAHWMAVSSHHLVESGLEHLSVHGIRGPFPWAEWSLHLAIVVIAALLIVPIYRFVRRITHGELRIRAERESGPCDGLILFLSHAIRPDVDNITLIPQPDGTVKEEDTTAWADYQKKVEGYSIRLPNRQAGDLFGKGSWAMPVRSISHQLEHGLKYIVVIASADDQDRTNGTWRQFGFFRKMLEKWIPEAAQRPEIVLSTPHGVSFVDLDAIRRAIDRAYEFLEKNGIRKILLDITGGTKQCSIAGGIHSLDAGRRFKYVTFSGEDREYDLQYHPPGGPSHGPEE